MADRPAGAPARCTGAKNTELAEYRMAAALESTASAAM